MMTGFTVFESRPSLDDAPDSCQQSGCDKAPTHSLYFPGKHSEYVCYCHEHCEYHHDEGNGLNRKTIT